MDEEGQEEAIRRSTENGICSAATTRVLLDRLAGLRAFILADREKVAAFMLARSMATGHGDTIDALLLELGAEIDRQRSAAYSAGYNDALDEWKTAIAETTR